MQIPPGYVYTNVGFRGFPLAARYDAIASGEGRQGS